MAFPVAPIVGQTYTNGDGQRYVFTADGVWRVELGFAVDDLPQSVGDNYFYSAGLYFSSAFGAAGTDPILPLDARTPFNPVTITDPYATAHIIDDPLSMNAGGLLTIPSDGLWEYAFRGSTFLGGTQTVTACQVVLNNVTAMCAGSRQSVLLSTTVCTAMSFQAELAAGDVLDFRLNIELAGALPGYLSQTTSLKRVR